jgi:hypothetical protein
MRSVVDAEIVVFDPAVQIEREECQRHPHGSDSDIVHDSSEQVVAIEEGAFLGRGG